MKYACKKAESISFLSSGLYRWYGNRTHSALHTDAEANAWQARGLAALAVYRQ